MSTAEGFALHLRHEIVVDTFTLDAHDRATRFVRDLDLPPVSPVVEAAMHDQSRTGLAALAALLGREIPEPER